MKLIIENKFEIKYSKKKNTVHKINICENIMLKKLLLLICTCFFSLFLDWQKYELNKKKKRIKLVGVTLLLLFEIILNYFELLAVINNEYAFYSPYIHIFSCIDSIKHNDVNFIIFKVILTE